MTDQQLSIIWKKVLIDLKATISPGVYKTWLSKANLVAINDQEALIYVDNNFSKQSLERFAKQDILNSINTHSPSQIINISFEVFQTEDKPLEEGLFAQEPTDNGIKNYQQSSISHGVNNQDTEITSNLNPKYTFDSFIQGDSNRLAYAVATKVASSPGIAFNPLYLYGGVGLGKTHLMQAIGNEIISREPQKKVVYVSCETFTNEYVASIQKKQDSFKKKYRNVDVFLMDDIQFMAGKDGTQEEFFHTFNALFQTNKQIVITSDKAPKDIKNLEDRLSSRVESGMITDMQLPDVETRQAILQAKCEEKSVFFNPSVLGYVAELVETNIRELEGALITLMAHFPNNQNPSFEQIRGALKNFSHHSTLRMSNLDVLKDVIYDSYNVSDKELLGKGRQQEIVKPRQILMYLMKTELGMTYPSIGREIGGRDHTTAMHAVEKIEKEMKKNDEMLDELQEVKSRYYAKIR